MAGVEYSQCAHWFNLLSLGVCLLPRNPSPFTRQAFQETYVLRNTGKFLEKNSWQLLGSPHCPNSEVDLPQSRELNPGPPRFTEVYTVLAESPKTKLHVWLPATVKAKLMGQVLVQKENVLFRSHNWENVGLPSQRPSRLPAQAHSCYRDREGRACVLFNILLAFGTQEFCLFIFLAFGWLRPCFSSFWCSWALSIHLSSFWHAQCKNLPAPSWPIVGTQLWRRTAGLIIRKPGDSAVISLLLDAGLPTHLGEPFEVSRVTLDSGMPVSFVQPLNDPHH